jgi:pyruvate/2-oxoglutarate dehydrogenase complex dihydrolipoamide dehydrogenase (E3) component
MRGSTEFRGKSGQSVSIALAQNGAETVIEGSHVLVATGRTPNTEGLGLELAGIELTDHGYIKVNERLQTAPGVWAIGEVAGSPQFTHISVDDFRVVHANITGGNRVTTGRQVPSCLFTDPELAHIGLNEAEAKAQGIAYRLFKVPMKIDLRARTLSETREFLKALVEADHDQILGFTAFGVGAGEIMSAVQIAMIAGQYRNARCRSHTSHISRGTDPAVLISAVGPQCRGCNLNDRRVRSFRLRIHYEREEL